MSQLKMYEIYLKEPVKSIKNKENVKRVQMFVMDLTFKGFPMFN